MKRILSLLAVILFVSVLVPTKAIASSGIPYPTFTLGASNEFIYTQTAFIPIGILNRNTLLNAPEDIYYKDGNFYIADSKSKRVVVINEHGEEVKIIKIDEFVLPMGVFVDHEDNIFVADKDAQAVFKVSQDGILLQAFYRPDSPLYGKSTKYLPIKVAVASNGNIYIIGEGATNGVITLNYTGEFIGYIGINKAPTSLRKFFFNLFVPDSELADTVPPSPINIALDSKNTIFTVNQQIRETFKRLNFDGVNTLQGNTYYPTSGLVDIAISDNNYIYLVSKNGDVYEYDSKGNMLFAFNCFDYNKSQIMGLVDTPSGIEVDDKGNLYIIDKSNNKIQMYQKTPFVDLVHVAVELFNDGRYIESKPYWTEIIKQNASFALARSGLGYAYFKEGKNNEALEQFYLARNYSGYSQVYWDIRNEYIQQYGSMWLSIIIGVFLLYKIAKKILKKTPVYAYSLNTINKLKERKLIHDLFYAFNIFKKPIDTFYGLQRENKASYKSALIILGLFVATYLFGNYGSGFLFRSSTYLTGAYLQIINVLAVFIGYVFVNYLISTLFDGEGKFKDLFIATSYCLLPFIIIQVPLTIVSHVLTYNEMFVYSMISQISILWRLILIIMSIQNIHNFSFKRTLFNLLVTLFGVFMLALILFFIYMFTNQLIDYVNTIIKEVMYRVRY